MQLAGVVIPLILAVVNVEKASTSYATDRRTSERSGVVYCTTYARYSLLKLGKCEMGLKSR